jgi:hypothetical protein
LIKFICDNCGADAVYKFNWEFIYLGSESDVPAPFNEGKDHACEECKNRIGIFLVTRKPWVKDE